MINHEQSDGTSASATFALCGLLFIISLAAVMMWPTKTNSKKSSEASILFFGSMGTADLCKTFLR